MQSRVKTRGKWSIIEHVPTKKNIEVKDELKSETVKVKNIKSEKVTK